MALPLAAAGLALPPHRLGFPEVILAMALPTVAAGLALPPQWLWLQAEINLGARWLDRHREGVWSYSVH